MNEGFSPEDERLRRGVIRMCEQMAKAGWLESFGHTAHGLVIKRTAKGDDRIRQVKEILAEIQEGDFVDFDLVSFFTILHFADVDKR